MSQVYFRKLCFILISKTDSLMHYGETLRGRGQNYKWEFYLFISRKSTTNEK